MFITLTNNDTSKEIIKVLKAFKEKTLEIKKNAVARLNDKKKKVLLPYMQKKEKKIAAQLYLRMNDEIEKLLELAPKFVKAKLASSKLIYILELVLTLKKS